MSRIGACLWFKDSAEEAAAFHTSLFSHSRITAVTRYTTAGQEFHGRPPGSVMTVAYEIDGFSFTALNGGPHFAPSPSVSFFVRCEREEQVDRLWELLSPDGSVLMPLGAYPFNQRYGWIEDRFGVSWQLIVAPPAPRIVPCLLFVGDVCGKAEEAMKFYASVFDNSTVGDIARYGADQPPDREGTVMYGECRLAGQTVIAMDSAQDHAFTFTEGVSLIVDATSQAEIDTVWNALSAVPEAEQCGWLKDRYGLSWQVVPEAELNQMLQDPDEERVIRVLNAMFPMKKIDLAELRRAAGGVR